MPDNEKDLEEKDFEEFDDLSSFVDIDDLSSLEGIEAFVDMDDLGDIPDLDDLEKIDSQQVSMKESEPDIPAEDISDVMSLDEMPEEGPDVMSLDEMPEEGPDVMSLDEMPEEEPDVMSLDEMPEEEPDVMSLDEMPEEEPDVMSLDEMPEEEPDVMSLDEMPEEEPDVMSLDEMPEEEPDVMSLDEMPEEEPDVMSLDEMPEEEPDVMSLDEMPEEEPDVMSLDEMPEEESDMMSLDGGSEDTTGEESLDMMLDGLLDDLDMNGSLDSAEIGSESVEDIKEAPDADAADLFDMLGGGVDYTEESSENTEELLEAGLAKDLLPEETADAEEKQPGLLKRLFGNIVTDEIAEAERKALEEEKVKAEEKAEEDAKRKEEKEAARAVKKEEQAAKKAKQAEEKAAKQAAKAEAKAAKKAQKEEAAEEEAQLEVTGKLNKVGVSIIVVLAALFLTTEIVGTNIHGFSSAKKTAVRYFEMQKYTQAYQEVLGTSVKEKDPETYQKIKTVMQVQRSLNAYTSYDRMNYYPDALNALLRGIQRYDQNIETAKDLEVETDLDYCRDQIITLLQTEYGLSVSDAYDILGLDQESYTEEVVEIAMAKK